jgi:hypothetical protein
VNFRSPASCSRPSISNWSSASNRTAS